MASYNKVILMGNLTRDPQLSYLPSQTAVVEFSLATNRKYKKQDGSQGEEVCFTECKMFGKRAEVINKYLHKGDQLFVEGRLKYESWQAQDGSKRSKLCVFVENFEFMGGGKSNSNQNNQNNQGGQAHGGSQQNEGMAEEPAPFGPGGDDIPF